MDNNFTVKLISDRTGLSPQLIRTWEKRYKAVIPVRTATNRRMYSENDLEKLMLLKRATTMGLAISTIAHLSIKELYELVDKRNITEKVNYLPGRDDATDFHLNNCLTNIINFDYTGLESSLLNASSSLGQQTLLEKVIQPLMYRTGELWFNGEFQIAQEHMVSTIIRSLLGSMLISGKTDSKGPILLASTPNRQLHELGALAAAITAMNLGWRAIFLGPNLPIEEIANSIIKHQADAVALGLTYPTNDSALNLDLQRFRKIIDADFPIIIGGSGAVHYLDVIRSIQAIYIKDLNKLKNELVNLRSSTGTDGN